MSGYNGWANYETWRVNLEMLDGMTCEDLGIIPVIEDERDRDIRDLADILKTYCVELVEQDAQGFALDLALSFLDRVVWQEIAKHMLDDSFALSN